MNLSKFPELRAYRDDLAAKLRERGRSYAAALEEANATASRLHAAGIGVADAASPNEGVSDRDIREAVALVVSETRRTAGVTVLEGGKPQTAKKKQGRKAIIDEAVKQAVAKVFAEAGNGARVAAAAPAPAPAAPTAEQLRGMSDDAFMEQLGGALAARVTEAAPSRREVLGQLVQEAVSEGILPPSQAAAVLRENEILTADNAPTGEQLRKMSDDEFMSSMAGAMAQEADRLRPPAGTIPSPFLAGLQ